MQPSFLREIAVLETLEISKEGSEGFHDVLQALVDSAVRLTGADRVSLVLFDEKTRIKESFHRGRRLGRGFLESPTRVRSWSPRWAQGDVSGL